MATNDNTEIVEGIDIEKYDGVDKPYIPPEELDIGGELSLHTDTVEEVDPTTYEVIRHKIWNTNREMGNTVENIAVSKITLETRDFNTAINLQNGDFVYFGPYLQFFAGVLDWSTKWVLENRSENPGIEPGDMFIQNDPWVGSSHQPDVALMAPVFHEGQLFCWVTTVVHQNDVGGVTPGSFCQNASDIYEDPTPIPPVKIVEGGDIRQDIADTYKRHSRQPDHIALDLRASIASNNHAKSNIEDLIDSYGADTLKTVMQNVSERAAKTFSDKLERIPDGEWRARSYHEASMTGDDHVYEVELGLTKEGNQLIFDNKGTHEQVEGSINCTLAGMRGYLLTLLNLQMLPEEMGAVGGLTNHVSFDPESQTLSVADYGHGISPAGQYNSQLWMSLANRVITNMLLSSQDTELRKHALSSLITQWSMSINEGTNQRGDYFVGPMLDQMIGTSAATPFEDGQFADGEPWIPEGTGPNVESYERDWPLLYLYRHEHKNSGGSGYRRGGNGGKLAYIQHRGDVNPSTYTHDTQPKTLGTMGGGPGSRMELQYLRDSNVHEIIKNGSLPESLDEMEGDVEYPPPKGFGAGLEEDDVSEWAWQSAAGYGDPLDREPERVAGDIANGRITAEYARTEYGVVVDEDGVLDETATADLRESTRQRRLNEARTDFDDLIQE